MGTFKDIETMDNNYVVVFFLRSAEELILIITIDDRLTPLKKLKFWNVYLNIYNIAFLWRLLPEPVSSVL